jgi:biotin carboxyl carrier protein
MKLEAHTGETGYQLDVRIDNDNVLATVDDREYALDATEVEPGVFLFKHAGRIYEVIIADSQNGQPAEILVRGRRFDVSIVDPKRLRGSRSDHGHSQGQAEIKTAMPGKVVRIVATVGEPVQIGESVIVVEAMKMQNEMKSPIDGVVKEIRVSEGSTVNAGEVLVVIE